ncbi:molybdate ABC transporter substrate-binding protein [Rubrivirga marina]|uniref:Molybdate ABC transporter substrate-binding protein n=1 Tax=Rubrivirga marina TaxID=1196024 RepID=A0A271J1Q5_9BACT|nr:molybdate ABC transporter substrate-binding protein [Rubrivirga marina]PAP77290.1 molybdate ABC transporter substrate-binding protein [Rubrivirga marina]
MTRAALGLAVALLGGCARDDGAALVFAAASTVDVVRHVTEAETAAGRPASVSVAASSVLARQIAQGAPADVFVTADPDWIDWLVTQGVALIDRREVARGRLVVVGPADAPSTRSVADALAMAERIALADPSHVPAGAYAETSLRRLGVWDEVAPRVVAAGDVRAAVAAVETGTADCAVVYASDAQASSRVRVLAEVPEAVTPPIRYEAALLDPSRGRAVFDAIVGAGDVWREAGFDPARP